MWAAGTHATGRWLLCAHPWHVLDSSHCMHPVATLPIVLTQLPTHTHPPTHTHTPRMSTHYYRYGVTHSGLDSMVVRYMDEMNTFANLPDELAYPNHTRYGSREWARSVTLVLLGCCCGCTKD